MKIPGKRVAAPLLVIVSIAHVSWAQEAREVGHSQYALAGIHRVPLTTFGGPQLTWAFDAGYGITESQRSGRCASARLWQPWYRVGCLEGARV